VEILYAPKFIRQFKKLPEEIRLLAEKREEVFKKDPFDHRLKTHKLSGKWGRYFAFSVNFSYRIIFDFKNDKVARFYEIGTHDIYD